MTPRGIAMLSALGAIWGGSYVFMRLGAGEFGPFALAGLRAAGAAVVLLPLLRAAQDRAALRRHWRAVAAASYISRCSPAFSPPRIT